MPSDFQIAQSLLAACIGAGHKPGKVQFTKYLYLLDYCHWRFTGRKVTSMPWKFYHYGPWCEQAEDCMAGLASEFRFNWREEGAPFLNTVEVPACKLDINTKSLIVQIVGAFKDRDLNHLLEFTYSETEPMAFAGRGDILDFSAVPIDRKMPVFYTSPSANAGEFHLHPERVKQIEAFRCRAERLKEKARQRMLFRESESYQKAVELIKDEFAAPERLPDMSGSLEIESAHDFAQG